MVWKRRRKNYKMSFTVNMKKFRAALAKQELSEKNKLK
jgi:hypothetical protein